MPSLKKSKNSKSVLFLHEGYTEGEFYEQIFNLKIPPRSIRIKKKNLEGNYNINQKVANNIDTHLKSSKDENDIYIIVALDREGNRSKSPPINVQLIQQKINDPRIKKIELIIATQDIESWFFIDIGNIYKFLNIKPSKHDISKYEHYEKFNNVNLSQLFLKHGRIYQKRKRVDKFIEHLNLEKIYNTCPELKSGIDMIIKLCS